MTVRIVPHIVPERHHRADGPRLPVRLMGAQAELRTGIDQGVLR